MCVYQKKQDKLKISLVVDILPKPHCQLNEFSRLLQIAFMQDNVPYCICIVFNAGIFLEQEHCDETTFRIKHTFPLFHLKFGLKFFLWSSLHCLNRRSITKKPILV